MFQTDTFQTDSFQLGPLNPSYVQTYDGSDLSPPVFQVRKRVAIDLADNTFSVAKPSFPIPPPTFANTMFDGVTGYSTPIVGSNWYPLAPKFIPVPATGFFDAISIRFLIAEDSTWYALAKYLTVLPPLPSGFVTDVIRKAKPSIPEFGAGPFVVQAPLITLPQSFFTDKIVIQTNLKLPFSSEFWLPPATIGVPDSFFDCFTAITTNIDDWDWVNVAPVQQITFAEGFLSNNQFFKPKLRINYSTDVLPPAVAPVLPVSMFDGVVNYTTLAGNWNWYPLTQLASAVTQVLPEGYFDGISVRFNLAEDSTFYPLQPITQVTPTLFFGWSIQPPIIKAGIVTVSGSETEVPQVLPPSWFDVINPIIVRYGQSVSSTLTEAPKVDNPIWGWDYNLHYKIAKPLNVTQQQFASLVVRIVVTPATAQWFWGMPTEVFYKNPRITHDFQTHAPLSTTAANLSAQGFFDGVVQYSAPISPWLVMPLNKPQAAQAAPEGFFDGVVVGRLLAEDNTGFQARGTVTTTFPDGWAGYQWSQQLKKPYPPLDQAQPAWLFTPPPPPAALNYGFGGYMLDYKVTAKQYPAQLQQFAYFTPQGTIISVSVDLHERFFIHNVGRLMGIR